MKTSKKVTSNKFQWEIQNILMGNVYITFFPMDIRKGQTYLRPSKIPSKPAFTCSKLVIKTVEKGVKYVQS